MKKTTTLRFVTKCERRFYRVSLSLPDGLAIDDTPIGDCDFYCWVFCGVMNGEVCAVKLFPLGLEWDSDPEGLLDWSEDLFRHTEEHARKIDRAQQRTFKDGRARLLHTSVQICDVHRDDELMETFNRIGVAVTAWVPGACTLKDLILDRPDRFAEIKGTLREQYVALKREVTQSLREDWHGDVDLLVSDTAQLCVMYPLLEDWRPHPKEDFGRDFDAACACISGDWTGFDDE